MERSLFQDMMIVSCAMSPDFMAVRVNHPNEAMAALGCRVRTFERQIALPRQVDPGMVKVMILQRPALQKEGCWIPFRAALDGDWLLVVEFDDHVELLPPAIRDKLLNGMGLDCFRACHGVQTTTPGLEDYFRQFNPNVRSFANQIFRYPISSKPVSDKVRIFFGALNRGPSWHPLVDAVNRALAGRNDVRLQVMGDRGFFDAVDVPDKIFKPFGDYDSYMAGLHNSDIVLSPLEPTPENNCKTDVKFLEAAMCGAVMIASPTVYGATIRHGETGLVARSFNDWENGLRTLIEKPGLRHRMAAAAERYVRHERMLMQHIHKRLDWYRELWAARAAINARLRESFPALRGGQS